MQITEDGRHMYGVNELWGLAVEAKSPIMGLGCVGCTFRHVRGPSKDFSCRVAASSRGLLCGDWRWLREEACKSTDSSLCLFDASSPMVCRKISEGQRLVQWLAKGNKT